MKVALTRRAARDLDRLSRQLQAQVRKQFELLLSDVRHPSLRVKKYGGEHDLWQGRVNRDYQFFFTVEDDTYLVLAIVPHPK